MTEATFFETRPFSPTSLALIIALHAAAITAAMAWRLEVIPHRPTTTIIDMIRETDPPPVPPRPREPIKEQPTFVPRIDPVVATRPVEPIDLTTIERPSVPEIIDQPVLPLDPPPAPLLQSARAKGDVRTLITSDDYPETARRNEETGTVQARLEIGASGKVTGCSIVTSSGSTALDAATCKVLKARARFSPAKDNDGQPVSDSYVTPRIVWRIEGRG